jgi:transposase
MITLMIKNEIISLLRQGYNESQIARKTKFSRTTVRKWAKIYKTALEQSSGDGTLEDFLCERPKYNSSGRQKRKLSRFMMEYIDNCLKDNVIKSRTGRKKQQMLNYDIYEQLKKQECDISYTTVCNYAKVRKTQLFNPPLKEGFIKQWYIPGENCEFDWGEVNIFIGGKLQRLYIAAVSLCSNGRWGALYYRQDTLAFMESHVSAFRYFGGIPGMMVYDNMRVAIKKFTGNEKKPTDALVRMSGFYGFNYRFCNIASGNEKGHVERAVEVLRRKAFSIKDRFESLEQANQYLLSVCGELNAEPRIRNLFIREKNSLAPLTGDMACFEAKTHKVDKLSTFSLNNSHYSVPSKYIKGSVWVKMFSHSILAYDTAENPKTLIARHERSYEPGWILDIMHYLDILKVKPGALSHSVALQQAPQDLRKLYQRHFTGKERSFIELLIYAYQQEIPYDELCQAALIAERKGVKDVTQSHIKVILENNDTLQPVQSTEITRFAQDNLKILSQLLNTSL